jgi:hypothetical protein
VNEAITKPDFMAPSDAKPQMPIGMVLGIVVMVGLEFG